MTCQALGRFVAGFYPTWDQAEFDRLLGLLDLPPRRRVSHLSGGMRVKLALALALAHRPPILVLDEPMAGLDPATRREFLDIIRRQARADRRTTFLSSHLIDEVERVADRVGIIHNGRMRYEGDIARLKQCVRDVEHRPSSISPVPPAAEPDDAARKAFGELAATSGFAVLRDGFGEAASSAVFGTPEAWADAPFGDRQVRPLSLEDIFISMTAEATAQVWTSGFVAVSSAKGNTNL
jgi:ABC-2 type transport system ATP-binding protein